MNTSVEKSGEKGFITGRGQYKLNVFPFSEERDGPVMPYGK